MSIDWSLAGSVVLTGLVLVFVILYILIVIVEITSKAASSKTESKAAKDAAAPKVQQAVLPQAPVIGTGIEEETVAAIMAAVSCMTDTVSGAQYTVRSINRAKNERPVWGFAGMQQNTRPF